jgi:hypothetical protein
VSERASAGFDAAAWLAIAAIAIAALACATRREPEPAAPSEALPANIMPAQRIPQPPAQKLSRDGLVEILAPELKGRIWVRLPRPGLQNFDKLLLAKPEFTYRRGTEAFSPRAEEVLRNYFDRRVREELGGSPGWELTETPGARVLSVGIAVHDLALAKSAPETTSAITRASASAPCVLRLELFDSNNNQVLLRFVQRRYLQPGTFGSGEFDTLRLRREFDEFAREIGRHLRSYYAASREVQRREAAGEK